MSKRLAATVGVAAALSLGTAGVVVAAGAQGKGPASVLSSLVQDGTLTQEQADKVAAKLKERRDQMMAVRKDRLQQMQAVVSKVLGKSTADIQKERAAGKSLAQIAGDKKDELAKAMVEQITSQVDQAVKDGKLTAEQATKVKQNANSRVEKMLNNTGQPGGRQGFGAGKRGGAQGGQG
ncbi:MAG: hypothetical protein WCP28_21615 [Actinomycetes bacterium]